MNFPAREALWGAGARWTTPLGGQALPGDLLLTQACLALLLVAVLVAVGWRARWSLDARRRGSGPDPSRNDSARNAPARTARNLAHNAAVLAVGAQICLAYVLSGLFKLQGAEWLDGSAVYYPLLLPQFRPWPALADLVAGSEWLVPAVTWGALTLQLAFPLLLLHRRLRTVAVAGALLMHAGIAVVMGLPFFSLFMMAGDCVFLRDHPPHPPRQTD